MHHVGPVRAQLTVYGFHGRPTRLAQGVPEVSQMHVRNRSMFGQVHNLLRPQSLAVRAQPLFLCPAQ